MQPYQCVCSQHTPEVVLSNILVVQQPILFTQSNSSHFSRKATSFITAFISPLSIFHKQSVALPGLLFFSPPHCLFQFHWFFLFYSVFTPFLFFTHSTYCFRLSLFRIISRTLFLLLFVYKFLIN